MGISIMGSVELFEKMELTYTIEKILPGRDANGNPNRKVVTDKLLVMFAPFKNPQLHREPGSDQTLIPGRGELVKPMSFPSGVVVGTTLTGVYAGQDVEIKIDTIIPNDLPGIDFGDYFAASMRVVRATPVPPEP